MGWNSWNKFACDVSEKLIRETADAVVSSGMKDAGYQFVNIDDCWQVSRAADGTIVADAERFPSGMKALADYVHSKGLKLGIYTDAGSMTCQKRPGSFEHEAQDIKTYASWGVDYVKIDWCYAEDLDPEVQYPKFRDAIAQSGRPIVFSICNWGVKAPWSWGPRTGNLWRTTGDISDNYDRMSVIGFAQNGLEKYAGPGHWNDPDMLVVGQVGWGQPHPTKLTPDEQYTHISIWCLLSAPLLLGCDLEQMDKFTLNLLTNDEVLAVNQDELGKEARCVIKEGDLRVYAKDLADGSKAVGLFNLGEAESTVTVPWSELKLSGKRTVRDLWRQKDLGKFDSEFRLPVAPHGAELIKIGKP